MSAPKLVTVYGLLAKAESTYNGGATLSAATNGVLLAEPATLAIDYVHDGARGPAPGASGQMKRGRPSGMFGETTFTIEGRGLGSAYTTASLPEIDPLLKAAGHSASYAGPTGSEVITYKPISSGFTSNALELYCRGQKYSMSGSYADTSWNIDGPSFMMFEFNTRGTVSTPSDTSVPSITYNSTQPPKAESVALSIGGWSGAVVRSARFNANRSTSPRANINSAGHSGYSVGYRDPELILTIEAVPLATYNPYSVRDLATAATITLTVGSVQYNKVQFTANQAQLVNVEEGEDDATATWTLTYRLATTTPIADDDYEIKFL